MFKTKRQKRLVALLLSLVLALSAIGVITFAEQPDVSVIGSSSVEKLGTSNEVVVANPTALLDGISTFAGKDDDIISLTSRDIVLILDESWSMSNGGASPEPWKDQQKAAKNFVETTFERSPYSRIGIVYFSSVGSTHNPAGASIVGTGLYEASGEAALLSAIDAKTAQVNNTTNGATDYSLALTTAETLFKNSIETNLKSKRIMIFLTDGQPFSDTGTMGEEIFKIADYNGAGVAANHIDSANKAYNTAKNLKVAEHNGQKIVNEIYTIGFFHNLTGAPRRLGEDLLKYYIAQTDEHYFAYDEDAGGLEIIFDDIIDDMVNVSPIIILPDVMGSELYDGGTMVWPPTTMDANFEAKFKSTNPLSVPASKNLTDYGGGAVHINAPEYGVNDMYKTMVDIIIERFDERAVYFYSYDFRQSYEDNAAQFDTFLNGVLTQHDRKTADVIAHGAGGLVLGHYLESYPANISTINHGIFLSTPFEGVPGVLGAAISNTDYSDYPGYTSNDMILDLSGMSKELVISTPGFAELIPTTDYLSHTDLEMIDSVSGLPTTLSATAAETLIEEIFTTTNYTNLRAAQAKLDFYDLLDNSQKLNPIYSGGSPTIESVVFDRDGGGKLIIDSYKFNSYGDGVVPRASLNLNDKIDNAHNIMARRTDISGHTHNQIAGSDTIINAGVLEKYTEGVVAINALLNKNNDYTGNTNPETGRPYQVIRIACPVDVKILLNGTVILDSAAGLTTSEYGNLYLAEGENGQVKMAALADGNTYTIEIAGYANGTMDYSVITVDKDNAEQNKLKALDIPVTSVTKAIAQSKLSTDNIIEVDTDGDGKNDYLYKTNGSLVIIEPEEPSKPEPEKPDPKPEPPVKPGLTIDPSFYLNKGTSKNTVFSKGADVSVFSQSTTKAGGKFTASAAEELFNKSLKAQTNSSVVIIRAYSYASADASAIAKVRDLADKAGVEAVIYFDTIIGNKVATRVKVDPKEVTTDINVTAQTNTEGLNNMFSKYYSNDLYVSSFAQKAFSGYVEVAVDAKIKNTSDLRFYEYDITANSYTPILNPQYRVDGKGYVHFVSEVNSIIVISDGALVKK